MITIELFDTGACCSTGLTNPEGKMASIQLAVAISNLSQNGYDVRGYSLLKDTAEFESNHEVKDQLLMDPHSLPITLVNGTVVKTHALPTAQELSQWTGVSIEELTGKKSMK
ncbi:arsenic metallochaperone ArsD family protein [Paenibacillus sp. LS1]|uniref:arsenic metallochaperone ArsD family protein n=1 Tax=Paenibacillus sp. LS1 TaxID=2992120 RepID=UPI002230258A|nr:arsenic metallochaperone ArsD family protein [Paenibacillus sp. LS1]MCW3794465.1 arsenic metallochaperone ArsD family protein [Paenibacillus sp. LS1]